MKLICYFIFVVLLPYLALGQAGEWTWMKGDVVPDNQGNFGIKGVPSPANEPPNVYAPAFWTDTAGNFWVYGGSTLDSVQVYNYDSTLSTYYNLDQSGSLWKFNPISTNWAWMNGAPPLSYYNYDYPPKFAAPAGVFDSANTPGSLGYGMCTWTDKQNHLWLYGGGDDNTQLVSNNLWQYDPAINEWAWMNGAQLNLSYPVYGIKGMPAPENTPGARYEGSAAWIDNDDNLWLFGGFGVSDNGLDFFSYNDLWRYDMKSGMWAWMSGSNNPEDTGLYGQMGVASVNCYPSSRASNMHWQDSLGNFWLVGGWDDNISEGFYNDVWKFNPATLEWTWAKGLPFPYATPNIAANNCTAAFNNQEGSRFENRATWKICDNLIINYAGFAGGAEFNDLWAFLPDSSEWMRINEYPYYGNRGTQGVPAPQNCPHSRMGAASFLDKAGNLWMFGGMSINSPDSAAFVNDLWKYVLAPTCIGSYYCGPVCTIDSSPAISAIVNFICPNDSVNICVPTGFSSYAWNTSASTGNCIEAKAAGTYYVTVTDTSGCTAESNPISINLSQTPTVTISTNVNTQNVYNNDTVTLNTIAGNFINPLYSWTPSQGLSCTNCPNPTVTIEESMVVPPVIYYVRVSDSLDANCTAYDSIVILIKAQFAMPTVFTPNGDGKNDYFGPVSYSYLTIRGFRIYDRWGQLVHNSTEYWDGKFNGKEQPPGAYVYYIEVQYPDLINPGMTDIGKKEGSVVLLR